MAKTKVITVEEDMKNEVANITEAAGQLQISDKPSFDIAGQYLIKLQTIRKTVVDYFKPLKVATHKAHKAVTQKEKDELNPIDEADGIVRRMRIVYNDAQEKKRKKEQDRLDKLAQAKLERDQAKLQGKIDNSRTQEQKEELQDKLDNTYAQPNIASGAMEKTTRLEGGGSTTWVEDIEVEVPNMKYLLGEIIGDRVPLGVIEIKHSRLKAWVKANDIKNGQIQGLTIRKTRRESVKGI